VRTLALSLAQAAAKRQPTHKMIMSKQDVQSHGTVSNSRRSGSAIGGP
jgi:hypothetical protein